jgi:choline-sulfatase
MKKPNILWIYCDELRTDALGCYGNTYAPMQTPNIDAIAENGVRFDNCFCNSPVCVASRSSILTGLYPEETGVYHNEAVWPNYRFEPRPLTFPQVFADHGYQTANFGKVHVPKQLANWGHSNTAGSGMMEFYQDVDVDRLQAIRPPGIPTVIGGAFPGDRPYPADAVTHNALAWMSQVEGPFLTRVSYLQPHTPVFPPPPYDSLYENAAFPDTIHAVDTLSAFEQRFVDVIRARELSSAELLRAKRSYYGLVAWIDAQVGRLIDFLRESGLAEETIIVFESDHGASLGEAGRYQKQTFAPQSQRVPRLISWPGTIARGQERADITESLDLARTLFGLAGIESPKQFHGRDLFADPAPEAVYSTIGYGFETSRAFPNLGVGALEDGSGWPRRSCVRTQRYRLDKNVRVNGHKPTAEREDIFLVDMHTDPDENVNLAADRALRTLVEELSTLVDQHTTNSLEVPEAYTQRDEAQERRIARFREQISLSNNR